MSANFTPVLRISSYSGPGWWMYSLHKCKQTWSSSLLNTSNACSKRKIVSCAAGRGHSIALSSDGTVYVWGACSQGQLGLDLGQEAELGGMNNNLLEPISRPTKLEEFCPLGGHPDSRVIFIACGQDHSLVVTCSGELFAWGRNDYGQLGVGDRYVTLIC